ncbi:ATP-binding protein, partial [Pseudomonadota bacterium]
NTLYLNKGGRQLMGIGEEEDVTQLKMWDYHSVDVFKRINEGLGTAREHGAWVGETVFLTRDGREVVTSQVMLAHKDSQGELEYYSTIARDISEQKKMELELQQTNEELRQEIEQRERIERHLKAAIQAADEANQAKSEFLANMSHEIRTPMQAIIGMADMLVETPLSDEQSHLVTTLEHAGNSLLEIVNNILDLSKIEAGKIELTIARFDVSSVIDAVMRICSFKARDKGIDISSHIATDIPPSLLGDRVYLQQVLINLIDNAIKFTSQGHIAVKVEMNQADECRHIADYDAEQNTCCLQFSITDTGIGIPKELQQKIFDAFSQADASTTRMFGGTGLGTTISKRIVEKMGGQIWVDSEPGKGSIFFFTAEFALPSGPVTQDLETASEASEENERPLNILVAEDSEDIRLLILSYLKSLPHTVDMAVNGAEAVEKYRAANYDLILMDMEMPVMDGYTAVKTIRELEAGDPDAELVPIVALTAHALREHEQRSLDAGCTGHVTKPIKKAQLLALVRDFARR